MIDVETGATIPMTKTAQVKAIGNSVPWHVAAAIVRANCTDARQAVAA